MGIVAALLPWARITYQTETAQLITTWAIKSFPSPDSEIYGDYCNPSTSIRDSADLEERVYFTLTTAMLITAVNILLWAIYTAALGLRYYFSITRKRVIIRIILWMLILAIILFLILALYGPILGTLLIGCYYINLPSSAHVLDVQPFWPTIVLAMLSTLTALAALLIKPPQKQKET
jgi:hypothetical protein